MRLDSGIKSFTRPVFRAYHLIFNSVSKFFARYITGRRGGIHNSVTRICPKPTHMIGGYAQLAYGFNYYGTVGSNRDEFIMIRKMKHVNWLDDEGNDQVQEAKQ